MRDSRREKPLLIYLDQNKWIDFARADHGRTDGEPYVATLDLAKAAVERGNIVFPLSSTHYVETLNTNDEARRQRLAKTMAVLSQFITLIDPAVMREAELRKAMRSHFGEAVASIDYELVGAGQAHAFCSSGSESLLTPSDIGRDAWLQLELLLLTGTYTSWQGPKSVWKDNAERFSQNTRALDALFDANHVSTTDRRQLLRIEETKALLDQVCSILGSSGIIPESLDPEWAWNLLDLLPFLSCIHTLLMALYENPDIKRQQSNFADVIGLAQAIVACDVVVTEKLWVDLARRNSLHERFGTTILSDLRELKVYLNPLLNQ